MANTQRGGSNGTHRGATRKSVSGSSKKRRISLNPEWPHDFPCEMRVVEMGAIKLYEKALNQLEHQELKSKLMEFCAKQSATLNSVWRC